jgi:hypothetical protein
MMLASNTKNDTALALAWLEHESEKSLHAAWGLLMMMDEKDQMLDRAAYWGSQVSEYNVRVESLVGNPEPALAGESYPEDPNLLLDWLEENLRRLAAKPGADRRLIEANFINELHQQVRADIEVLRARRMEVLKVDAELDAVGNEIVANRNTIFSGMDFPADEKTFAGWLMQNLEQLAAKPGADRRVRAAQGLVLQLAKLNAPIVIEQKRKQRGQ